MRFTTNGMLNAPFASVVVTMGWYESQSSAPLPPSLHTAPPMLVFGVNPVPATVTA